jgi:hypothetical protein
LAVSGLSRYEDQKQLQKHKYQVDAVPVGVTGVAFHLARDLPRSGSKTMRLG